MRKSTVFICKNKGADQLRSNCKADQCLCFRYRIVQFRYFLNPNFQPLAIFYACSARFVLGLFRNKIVGFLMTQQILSEPNYLETVSETLPSELLKIVAALEWFNPTKD